MAGTPYDPAKFEESKSFHQKHIQIKPEDPEPYYWVGVIDWTLSFRANNELRARYNQAHIAHQIQDTEPLPPQAREEYVRNYGVMIDEGIEYLVRAIKLQPDYDDAMAYLNLLYRRKADAVASPSERDDLLLMANALIDRSHGDQTKAGGTAAPIEKKKETVSCVFLLADFGGKAAAVELEPNGVANLNLCSVAEDDAVGVCGDRVAAFEGF